MKQIVTLLLSTVCLFTVSAQSKEKKPDYAKRLAGVEKELEKILSDQKVAGFSVAVVYKDQVLLSKGFGYRDLENKKPVTPNTLFAIGSSTKAFTAAMLGQLEKEGKLKLDDVVTIHLPQLRFKYDYMNSGITIRDMMCHRTGLSRFDYSWYLFNSANRNSLIQRVQYMEPNYKLREKWQYNNWMFLVQGMVAERLTQKTWEENIRERFFLPLNMAHSNTSIQQTKNDSDASLPYSLDAKRTIEKVDYYDINGMGPAGSINSCSNDMAKWLTTWIMGGTYQGKEIIPAGYLRAASSSQMVVSGGLPGKHPDVQFLNYGLGWFIESYRGHYLVEHGGNIDGFSANVAFYPSDSIGIVVLVNQNASAAPETVRNLISDRLFALPAIPWASDTKAQLDEMETALAKTADHTDTIQVKGTHVSHPLKDYAGYYSNQAFGNFTVVAENDTLSVTLDGQRMWLKHYHYDVFELIPADKSSEEDLNSKLLLNFATASDGSIESISVKMDEPGKNTVFKRSMPKVDLSGAELEKYVGEYDLSGHTVKIYLKGQTLMVLVPGQPDYETVAVGDDTFNLTVADGYSVKFTVENGLATTITFRQPNGNFTAKRK